MVRIRKLIAQVAVVITGLGLVLGVVAGGVVVAREPAAFAARAGALVVGLLVVAAALRALGATGVPRRTIVELDLLEPVSEDLPPGALGAVSASRTLVLRDLLDALERAASDRRVKALLVRVRRPAAGLAQVQELQDAITAFRASGKPAFAFAETFGEFSAGNAAYLLATSCNEILLQPSGDVNFTGLLAIAPFLRGTFDKLGIVPRFGQRYEYKNAANAYTERAFTPAHREATEAVVRSQFDQLVRAVAAARGLTDDEVRAAADRGPLLAAEALEARFVDALAYHDEAVEHVVQHVGGAKLLAFDKYRKRAKKRARGTTVALVVATGPVQLGRSGGYDPLTRGASMGSDTVARALRDAGGDKRVKAVLFRVDSPGGSYVASDTIWRETVRLRERGKPVVVSMGNVAGSGGYFVAMAANRIVAQPGTITGSIGVLGGKLVTTGLREKAGLSIDEVHTSEHARLYSAAFDYSASELQRVDAFLDRVYLDFTTKVASGRHKERADVHEVARGRIWTGEQAIGHGLVDALGGYPAALRAVREVAGLAPDAPVRLKQFPGRSPLARLRAQRSERSRPDLAASARSLAHGLGITDAGALSVPVHLLPRW